MGVRGGCWACRIVLLALSSRLFYSIRLSCIIFSVFQSILYLYTKSLCLFFEIQQFQYLQVLLNIEKLPFFLHPIYLYQYLLLYFSVGKCMIEWLWVTDIIFYICKLMTDIQLVNQLKFKISSLESQLADKQRTL